jgi:hypothetical protein
MTDAALVWLVVGGLCAVIFFGIAAVVSVYGIGDLRRLLHGAERRLKGEDRD